MTLSFRLGSIPVRIHPVVLLMGMLLGLGGEFTPLTIAGRGAAFFFAIFADELGHAVTASSFGLPTEVNLTLLRGALGAWTASLSSRRAVAVCLAGPAANLGVATIVFAMLRAHPLAGELGAGTLAYLGRLNLGWGLLNLLPILPLDAGYALAAALDARVPGRGEPVVRGISIGTVLALGGVALVARMPLLGLVCALLAFQNAHALGIARAQRNRDAIARAHLRAAFAALERGEPALAISHCAAILEASANLTIHNDAVRLLAYAYATSSRWGNLIALLESGGIGVLPEGELEKYQRAARELGRSEDAARIAVLRSSMV